MPKFRMLADISGTRDGAEWPKRGELVELTNEEAESYLTAGIVGKPKDAVDEPAAEKQPTVTVESASVDTSPKRR